MEHKERIFKGEDITSLKHVPLVLTDDWKWEHCGGVLLLSVQTLTITQS